MFFLPPYFFLKLDTLWQVHDINLLCLCVISQSYILVYRILLKISYIYIYRIFSIDHRIYIVIYDIRYTKYDLFVYRIHYSAFFQGLWGQSLPLVFLCTLCVFDTDCTYVLNFEFLTFTEACKFVR